MNKLTRYVRSRTAEKRAEQVNSQFEKCNRHNEWLRAGGYCQGCATEQGRM